MKWKVYFLGLCVCMGAVTTNAIALDIAPIEECHPGDLNEDEIVNVLDILALVSWMLGLSTPPECSDDGFTEGYELGQQAAYCDECGVLNGLGAVDECGCEGIPEGDCDCNGNVYDCAGNCGGSLVLDCAGICGGDGSSCDFCDGVPDSNAEIDECGVCAGPGIPDGACDCSGNVTDCAGVCGGGLENDCAGICGGDGSMCDYCDGIPFSETEVDACGECGGNNACLADPIGEPIGDMVTINHHMVKTAVHAHVTAHLGGLEASLQFLETSNALINLVEIISGDDEDDEDDEDDQGQEDEQTIHIDLSGLRDDLLNFLENHILVEETATLNESGTTLTYLFTPEFFCAEDESQDEMSEEDWNQQLEDEAKCAENITASPLRLVATTDGEYRIYLTLTAGMNETEVFQLQIHDDLIAAVAKLNGVKVFVETFVDPEDFELPETMTGSLGLEIRKLETLRYGLQFAIDQAIQLVPAEGQETIQLLLDSNLSPGGLVLDGGLGTILGNMSLTEILFGMPWQFMVDIMWDDEGSSETVCETNWMDQYTCSPICEPNATTGVMECWDECTSEWAEVENCWEEWVDGPESPDAEGMMNLLIHGVTAGIDVDSSTDTFHLTNLSLGDGAVVADVDGVPILQFALNPENGWAFDLKMIGDEVDTTRFEFSPLLDAQAIFSMDHVKEDLQDPPAFLLGDTLGVRMDSADTPALKLTRDGDDVDVMVSSGQLTFWSDLMGADIVINEGQCVASEDESTEDENLHGLFGGLYGADCEQE